MPHRRVLNNEQDSQLKVSFLLSKDERTEISMLLVG
jgi:hypothetical protein